MIPAISNQYSHIMPLNNRYAPLNPQIADIFYINHRDQRVFHFNIIKNVLVSSFRFYLNTYVTMVTGLRPLEICVPLPALKEYTYF